MSDILKCPFCQQELNQGNPQSIECRNDDCKKSYFMYGSEELWQELIRTRKKLDIVMDGLKRIEKLTEPSYKNRNLEALALAVNTFSGEIIKQINNKE